MQQVMKMPTRVPWIAGIALIMIAVAVGTWYTVIPTRLPQQYQYKYPSTLELRSKTRQEAYGQEIAFYQERFRRNPNDGLDLAALAGVYLRKARVSGQSGWYLLAEQSAQRSLAALPVFNSGAKLALAEIAQARHDFPQAIKWIDDVLKTEPRNSNAISLRATVNLALGNLNQAEQDIQTLNKFIPSSSNLSTLALIAEAGGKETEALTSFDRALAVEEPDDPYGSARMRVLLGRYQMRHGEYGLAGGLFKEALRIAPKYPFALLQLAELEAIQGNYRAAESHYNELLRLAQGSPSTFDHAALHGLARIKEIRGAADAGAFWDKTEQLLRGEVENGAFGHRRELAKLLLERGKDVEEALKQAKLESALRRDWETLSVLAWAQAKAGQLQEAKQTIDKVLATGVKSTEVFVRAAQIEEMLGNSGGSAKHLQMAQEVNPKLDGKTQVWLGLE